MDKNSENGNQEIVIVFGATGYLGFHIVKELLSLNNIKVRIIARSLKKVQQIFSPNEILKFESILEIDTSKESKMSLKRAFQPSEDGCQNFRVISVLASSKMFDTKQEFESSIISNRVLIETCKEFNVGQFVYISSMLISKPYNIFSILINWIVPNAFSNKVQIENILKSSELNYLIIRPGGLIDKYESKVHKVRLSQQDKGKTGILTRATAAKVTIEAMFDKDIPSFTSLDCFSLKNDTPQEFSWKEAKESWPIFTEDRVQFYDGHKKVQRLIKFAFLSTFLGITGYFMRDQILNYLRSKF